MRLCLRSGGVDKGPARGHDCTEPSLLLSAAGTATVLTQYGRAACKRWPPFELRMKLPPLVLSLVSILGLDVVTRGQKG